MKWLALSWRNVWRNSRRSLLAVSVMAVGALALLLAIGFILASFQGLRESTIRGGLGHLQVGDGAGIVAPDDLVALERAAEGHPEVRFTLRRLVFEGLVSTGAVTVAAVGSGVEPVKEGRLSSGFAPAVEGTGLPLEDAPDGFHAVLGIGLAAKLGVDPGDTVTLLTTTVDGVLNAIDATVAGTFTTGIPDLDARQVMIRLSAAQVLMNTQGASRLVVVLRQDGAVASVAGWLGEAFPAQRVSTWRELTPFYGQVVTLYGNIFTVLGVIILLVVALSATNTMLMAVTERIQEMGTMLALGIGRTRIRINFAIEGAMIGGLAGAMGLAGAAALSLGINLAGIEMPPPPGRTMPYPLIILVDATAYAAVFAAMVLAGAAAAWAPTARLGRLRVIDALRRT
ncbi:MAG: hypothetical protein VR70_17695 [Rhodospirillaceae bacterium BRH_c57]|nr:MAG: hypothetical protein VR70_17695 [Rhodospirillaceae bacterium BRH_c57]